MDGRDLNGVNRYRRFAEMRGKGPVAWSPDFMEGGAFMVTSYRECQALLRDKRLGRQALKAAAPQVVARQTAEQLEQARLRQQAMSFSDPPDHTRLRGALAPSFTAAAVEGHADRIRLVVEELVDALAPEHGADLAAQYAAEVPAAVIAGVLGLPPGDKARIKDWSVALVAGMDPAAGGSIPVPRLLAELDAYINEQIAFRRAEPGDDLISALANDPRGLSRAELTANLRGLVIAGHDTTRNLIANSMLNLLRRPELDGAEITDGAVDELLRFDSPLQATSRFAYQDLELGGTRIPAGSPVVAVLGAANRDPGKFPEPDLLVLDRPEAGQHLAFGAGIHFCVGNRLSKLEARVAIDALRRRLPGMTLVDERPQWKDIFNVRALQTLRVRW